MMSPSFPLLPLSQKRPRLARSEAERGIGQEGVDQDDDDSDKRDPKQGENTSTDNGSGPRGEGLVRSPLLLVHEWLVCYSVRRLLVCAMRLLVRLLMDAVCLLMRPVCLLVCVLRLLPRLHWNLPLGWTNPLGVAGVILDSRYPQRNAREIELFLFHKTFRYTLFQDWLSKREPRRGSAVCS
jgi:hypothetical protein